MNSQIIRIKTNFHGLGIGDWLIGIRHCEGAFFGDCGNLLFPVYGFLFTVYGFLFSVVY